MIGTILGKIAQNETLTSDEKNELIAWGNANNNSANLLSTIFREGSTQITELSQITDNPGTLVRGLFLSPTDASTSLEPTESGFTGTFMSGNGVEFDSGTYNVGGVQAGFLQAGFNTSGKFLAAGGNLLLDYRGVHGISAMPLVEVLADSDTFYGFYGTLNGVLGSVYGTTVFGIHAFNKSSTELISNGDFETGDYTDWAATGTPTVESGSPSGGLYCASVNNSNYLTQTITVSAANYYLLTFVFKKQHNSSVPQIMFSTNTDYGPGTPAGLGAHFFTTTTNWTKAVVVFKVESGSTADISIKSYSPYNQTAVLIDDVSITPIFHWTTDGMNSYTAKRMSLSDGVTESGTDYDQLHAEIG